MRLFWQTLKRRQRALRLCETISVRMNLPHRRRKHPWLRMNSPKPYTVMRWLPEDSPPPLLQAG